MSIKRYLILLIGMSLLSVLLLGCSKSKPKSESVQPTATRAAGGQTSGGASGPNSELAGLIDAYAKVKSLRAQIVIETTGTPKLEGTLEMVLPDKFHMTFAAGAVPGAGALEIIVIGSDTYLKIGPTWTKQAGLGGQPFDAKSVSGAVAGLQPANATKGGTATVSGKTCQLYTTTSATGSQEICVADGLPLRIVSQSSGSKTTLTFSDYNANIDIRAPI